MKLVTFTSFKGGAGKSTALMAAVPGLLGAGKRLALLEADENDTLALWRATPDASMTVFLFSTATAISTRSPMLNLQGPRG